MTAYSPTSRRERTALALIGAVLSVSLMASVLLLFSDGHVAQIRLEAAAAARDRSCNTAGSAAAGRCQAPAAAQARATATSPVVVAQEAKNADPKVLVASE